MRRLVTRLLRTQCIAIALLGCMLYPFPPQWVMILQGVLASIFVLYLPGLWSSHVLFVQGELSAFERFVMSIAISVAVIVFVSLYMHYFGIIISLINVFLIALCVIVVACVLILMRHLHQRSTKVF